MNLADSRSSSAWAYVLTFALIASSVSTLAVFGVTALSAMIPSDAYDVGPSIGLADPIALVFSGAYGLMPAGLTGLVASIARRGGTRFRFRLICAIMGGATSALFCLPWGLTLTTALIGAAYGAAGALAGAILTSGLLRRRVASA